MSQFEFDRTSALLGGVTEVGNRLDRARSSHIVVFHCGAAAARLLTTYSYNRICAGMKIRGGAMSDAAGIRRPAALVRRAAADQEKNNGDQLAGSRISFVRF